MLINIQKSKIKLTSKKDAKKYKNLAWLGSNPRPVDLRSRSSNPYASGMGLACTKPMPGRLAWGLLKPETGRIDDFMNSINFGGDFFYKCYLPENPNSVSFIELINSNLMSEHLSNYYDEVEENRSVLTNNIDLLIKFMKRAPYYLTRLKITSRKVAKLGIAYLLYSSGLILVNYPGKFTKHHKKHEILKSFDSFLEERDGRAPPKILLKDFVAFCSEF